MNKPYSIVNGVIMTPEDARDYDFRQKIVIRLSMLLYQSEKQLINTLTAGKTECTEHMVSKSVADRRDYYK